MEIKKTKLKKLNQRLVEEVQNRLIEERQIKAKKDIQLLKEIFLPDNTEINE